MKSQRRHLVAEALYPTKSYSLPSVCERYGLEPGSPDEAFSSKTRYVMRRLEKLSNETVFTVAKSGLQDFPDDKLQAAVDQLGKEGRLLSDITRLHPTEALNEFALAGKHDLIEMLRKHWPKIDKSGSDHDYTSSLIDDLYQHAVRNDGGVDLRTDFGRMNL